DYADAIRLVNPVNQEIIFSSIPENIYYLTVYAADGKLVLSANERLQNGHHLPLPPISPGIYFITLTPVGSTPKTLRLLKL
ncbi:MAG: T9SS type A sorting domain-containing protein, partial [Bacteroidota bacterium]